MILIVEFFTNGRKKRPFFLDFFRPYHYNIVKYIFTEALYGQMQNMW